RLAIMNELPASSVMAGSVTPYTNSGISLAEITVCTADGCWVSGMTTMTTSSCTIWLAQSVALPGSPEVSQATSSTGRPPMPAMYSLTYSNVASAAGFMWLLSSDEVTPSLMNPTFT